MGKKGQQRRQKVKVNTSTSISGVAKAAGILSLLILAVALYIATKGQRSPEIVTKTPEEPVSKQVLHGAPISRGLFDQAKDLLRMKQWEEAYAMLESAREAEDWKNFDLQHVVDVFQAGLLAFDMNPTQESRSRAMQLLLGVLEKIPNDPHALLAMGRVLNVLEHYEDAVPYLERAVKHTQGTPLHNGATRAYEIALQYVAFDSRQAVNATGKARARNAWKLMVKNALDNPHTDTGKQITEWSARAKAQTGSEDTCPTTNMDKWDPSKFAGTQECPRIHRAKGEPILDALRRAWGSGRITPAVLTGEWPEFSSLDSVVTTLEQCSSVPKSKKQKKTSNAAVVEVLIPQNDGGHATFVVNASTFAHNAEVAKLLLPGEDKVMVRGIQDNILLADFLALAGKAPLAMYLAQCNLDVHMPCARSLVRMPEELVFEEGTEVNASLDRGKLAEVNLWIGLGGTVSGLHSDGFHNLHRMLKGTKDVLLFPPEAADRLVNPNGIVEVKGSMESPSRVLRNPHFAEADCVNPTKFAAQAEAMRCVAQEGETFFIPDGWFHNVLTTPSTEEPYPCTSIGINLWYTS